MKEESSAFNLEINGVITTSNIDSYGNELTFIDNGDTTVIQPYNYNQFTAPNTLKYNFGIPAFPEKPLKVGYLGEMYVDEHGNEWVMSKKWGWKLVVSELRIEKEEVKTGKKRKLKCF